MKLLHPSFCCFVLGHYQALGRVIHMENLREQLVTQKEFNFAPTRENMNLVQQLEILADTLYIQVEFLDRFIFRLRRLQFKNNDRHVEFLTI